MSVSRSDHRLSQVIFSLQNNNDTSTLRVLSALFTERKCGTLHEQAL